ncbi:hypothetical protein Tco_1048072 [Tanacetum coccineum]
MKSRGPILPPSDLGGYGRDFYGYERTVLRCVSNRERVFKDDHAQCDLDFENNVMFNVDLDSLKKVDGVAHDLVSMLLNFLITHFFAPGKYLKFLMEVSDRINDKGDEPMLAAINAKSNEVFDVEWKSKINADSYKKMIHPPPQNHNSNHPNRKKPQKKIQN